MKDEEILEMLTSKKEAAENPPKKKRVVKRTPAQRAAENKYHKEKIRKISINFSPVDYDILEYLDTKESRSGYLKKLLREDMNRQNP